MKKQNFNLGIHYSHWPNEIREEFRDELIYDLCWVKQQTFYAWLSSGIPSKSKLVEPIKLLVEKYNKKVYENE